MFIPTEETVTRNGVVYTADKYLDLACAQMAYDVFIVNMPFEERITRVTSGVIDTILEEGNLAKVKAYEAANMKKQVRAEAKELKALRKWATDSKMIDDVDEQSIHQLRRWKEDEDAGADHY